MTVIISDFKHAINVMVHPDKETKSYTWKTGRGAIGRYYKVMLIPMILQIIFALILGNFVGGIFRSVLGTMVGSTFTTITAYTAYVAGFILVTYIILIPLGLVIAAGIMHLIGRGLKLFKNKSYDATLGAMVYGIMPAIVLSWIPYISLLGCLWSIAVMVIAISNLQKISRAAAFGVWLLTAVVGAILLLLVFGATAL